MNSLASVLSEELGCYNGPPVKLKVHDNAKPKFYKARSAPFKGHFPSEARLRLSWTAYSPKVFSHQLNTLPRLHQSYLAVLKKNGKVCICGDYKLTINQASPTEVYPLPLIDEYFSILDLENAYLQLPLDPASKQLVTLNTHRGLFQYNRLPLGVASVPAVFQQHMEMLLQGLDGVSVHLDDIVVAGHILDEHHQRLAQKIPNMAPSHIVQWAVILSAYNYTIRYTSGKRLCNADALSRLPQPVTTAKDCVPAIVVAIIDHLSTTADDAQATKEWTAKDLSLSCVHRILLSPPPTLGDTGSESIGQT